MRQTQDLNDNTRQLASQSNKSQPDTYHAENKWTKTLADTSRSREARIIKHVKCNQISIHLNPNMILFYPLSIIILSFCLFPPVSLFALLGRVEQTDCLLKAKKTHVITVKISQEETLERFYVELVFPFEKQK